MAKKPNLAKTVESLRHDEAKRKNIPTAEHQSVIQKEQESPRTARYQRNRDLDPQLVWRGKDEQDWSELVVHAPPLYIQEKVHPKVLIDDLLRTSKESQHESGHLKVSVGSLPRISKVERLFAAGSLHRGEPQSPPRPGRG